MEALQTPTLPKAESVRGFAVNSCNSRHATSFFSNVFRVAAHNTCAAMQLQPKCISKLKVVRRCLLLEIRCSSVSAYDGVYDTDLPIFKLRCSSAAFSNSARLLNTTSSRATAYTLPDGPACNFPKEEKLTSPGAYGSETVHSRTACFQQKPCWSHKLAMKDTILSVEFTP